MELRLCEDHMELGYIVLQINTFQNMAGRSHTDLSGIYERITLHALHSARNKLGLSYHSAVPNHLSRRGKNKHSKYSDALRLRLTVSSEIPGYPLEFPAVFVHFY